MQAPFSILIVENNLIYRNALVSLMEEFEFKVLPAVSNGKEALDSIKNYAPDVLLLDIEMPVMNGSDTLSELKKLRLKTKVIMISFHEDPTLIYNFIDRGASAFICKDKIADDQEIKIIIIEVIRNGFYYRNLPKRSVTLTNKELCVAIKMIEGKTTKQIANDLNITERTIYKHRNNLHNKLDAKSYIELITEICRKGFKFLKLNNNNNRS